ncbi:ketopantoate hydroxymethyltransferase [Dendrothele bispora CBS 962.96]|uniref:3-methyl-2-oxobutanoate hydroxymethyltransferase n=1 Tax=Dendrothele bispora (strain CBS 962.96) TaxID=1314807 RepID=A0A4S8MSN6_DENBC|nr:ketopantoate hydroxymethyltransferase [Dendrothele bispora CBS 962.96]
MMLSIAQNGRAALRLWRGAHDQRRWMSVRPPEASASSAIARKKVTIQSLQDMKTNKTPITMITAYDYPNALACSSNSLVDMTLVGDSLAQTCLGYSSTTQLTLSEMIHHTRAVARGTTHPFLVADMPFGTYHCSLDEATKNAIRLVQDGFVEGVKMEGGSEIAGTVHKLSSVGIPVMAHVGLLPQRHVAMSGYKVQGKSLGGAKRVMKDALALQEAGAFSIVLEAIPKELGRFITERLRIPTIGIGAGPWTDGQVLVWDDVMGTWSGHKAKFVRRFGDLKKERDSAVQGYVEAVKNRTFPNANSESYTIDSAEWDRFLKDEQ